MRFNSPEFFWFFAFVVLLYWPLFNRRVWLRNCFLIASSYLFYAWWDARFFSLIVLSTSIDYVVGRMMQSTTNATSRKAWLSVSLVANLGCLCFFKYFNFFAESSVALAAALGMELGWTELNIILPLGISFYTLQTLGYSIDVYRKRVDAETRPDVFFAYVCFFPQLVAGPIERSANLIPQFRKRSKLNEHQVREGFRLILFGLFKKVIIADTLAELVDPVFASLGTASPATLAWAIGFFAVQIYCDFAGYSQMAIGLAKLLGFDLMTNFQHPYFATSVSQFWRRWHISLSTWFRDYVYLLMGDNRMGFRWQLVNLWTVFSLSGLWHGASWTFVVWGWLHFFYMAVVRVWVAVKAGVFPDLNGERFPRWSCWLGTFLAWGLTMIAIAYGWLFFRADDVVLAWEAGSRVLSWRVLEAPDFSRVAIGWIALLFAAEASVHFGYESLQIRNWPLPLRWSTYAILCLFCMANLDDKSPFIYFQF